MCTWLILEDRVELELLFLWLEMKLGLQDYGRFKIVVLGPSVTHIGIEK
jgi:hypothetical protein